MTTPLTPIIPLAQMGHVEKIAEALQNQPGMQQALLQELAKEAIKEEQTQVPATDPSQKAQKLKVDDERKRRREEQRKKHKKQQQAQSGDTLPEDTSPRSPNPWTGNILDIKV